MATSGWSTKSGAGGSMYAVVYTDRSGSYPSTDTYIGITGQKSSAGGTAYYTMMVEYYDTDNSGWFGIGPIFTGYFASQSPMKKYYISNLPTRRSSYSVRVQMTLYSSSNKSYNTRVGTWTTNSFTVYK